MLKKMLTAGLAAGMIAIGAASASSLGITNSPTLAVSMVELEECTADSVTLTHGQQLQPTQPQFVYVNTVEINGLDCPGGEFVDVRLTDEDGTSLGVRFDVPIAQAGSVAFWGTGLPNVNAEDVYGVTIIAHGDGL